MFVRTNKYGVSSNDPLYKKIHYLENKEKYLERSKINYKGNKKVYCEICEIDVINLSQHKKFKYHLKKLDEKSK